MRTYCVKEKKQTECVGPEGIQKNSEECGFAIALPAELRKQDL